MPLKWFRSGLVSMDHRLLYHTTLGTRVMKKREEEYLGVEQEGTGVRRLVGFAREGEDGRVEVQRRIQPSDQLHTPLQPKGAKQLRTRHSRGMNVYRFLQRMQARH